MKRRPAVVTRRKTAVRHPDAAGKHRAFVAGVLGCLLLAGWALWSAGLVDGAVARTVRGSSIYAAEGSGLDVAAAERAVGNRRLVVILLARGADLGEECDAVKRAAAGTVVLLMTPSDSGYDTYGCAQLPGDDDENFGKAYVAETIIGRGVDQFAGRPLEAVKVIAVNYDLLVRAGTVPDGARTISPSLPRYLIAAAALVAVLLGTASIYLTGLRAGRAAAALRARRSEAGDERHELSAKAAALAQQIIDLENEYAGSGSAAFGRKYRSIAADYADLLPRLHTADPATLSAQLDHLSARCASLPKKR